MIWFLFRSAVDRLWQTWLFVFCLKLSPSEHVWVTGLTWSSLGSSHVDVPGWPVLPQHQKAEAGPVETWVMHGNAVNASNEHSKRTKRTWRKPNEHQIWPWISQIAIARKHAQNLQWGERSIQTRSRKRSATGQCFQMFPASSRLHLAFACICLNLFAVSFGFIVTGNGTPKNKSRTTHARLRLWCNGNDTHAKYMCKNEEVESMRSRNWINLICLNQRQDYQRPDHRQCPPLSAVWLFSIYSPCGRNNLLANLQQFGDKEWQGVTGKNVFPNPLWPLPAVGQFAGW